MRMSNMTDYLKLELTSEEIGRISNLGLAHIGDCVYELMVRSWLIRSGKLTASGMHSATVKYVSAPAQAAAMEKIADVLSEEEKTIYRRGRNARVHSVPKNAQKSQYHAATGLEALFGHLYLSGKTDRLNELFSIIMENN